MGGPAGRYFCHGGYGPGHAAPVPAGGTATILVHHEIEWCDAAFQISARDHSADIMPPAHGSHQRGLRVVAFRRAVFHAYRVHRHTMVQQGPDAGRVALSRRVIQRVATVNIGRRIKDLGVGAKF